MAKEVSIFLENKVGHFEKITRILKTNQVNILTMSITDTANGWGILNLLVDDPGMAYQALSNGGVSVALRNVIALEMKDEAGGLNELLIKIAAIGVNFNNAYGRNVKENNCAVLILDVTDYEEAVKKIAENGITILPDEKVYGNQ